ncbi:MAG: glycosyltransferase family 2 protein [Patescibacteria group bacterium]
MQTQKVKLSIVIPNWNGEKFLSKCLDSLLHQSENNIEIIVVDNGSGDQSETIIKKYKQVKLIKLKENCGFSIAVNVGIKAANSELIGLINNDTEVDENWVSEMYVAAKNHPEAGFFASKMIDYYHREIIAAAGDAMNWWGRAYNIGKYEKNNENFDSEKYVFGACAGASVYRKALFEKIGLFDEDFFMYLEDVDISLRAQYAGFKCLFVPGAIIYHMGSASAGKKSGFVFKYINKNRWHVMYKNFPLSRIIIYSPLILLSELRFLAAAIVKGYFTEYIWAVKTCISEHGKMIEKRKKILRERKVSFRYMDKLMGFF